MGAEGGNGGGAADGGWRGKGAGRGKLRRRGAQPPWCRKGGKGTDPCVEPRDRYESPAKSWLHLVNSSHLTPLRKEDEMVPTDAI
jgi:hypothetical protein